MAFFLTFPTSPDGFISKACISTQKLYIITQCTVTAKQMWHLQILSIPQVSDIIKTIIPTISHPILASSVLSVVGMRDRDRKCYNCLASTSSRSPGPAGNRRTSTKQLAGPPCVWRTKLKGGCSNMLSSFPLPRKRALVLQRNMDTS